MKKITAIVVTGLIIGLLGLAVVQADVSKSSFTDVTVNHWAYQQINDLWNKSYVTGYPDGSFRPDNSITRAEFMTMFANVLKDKYPAGAKYDHSKEKSIISVSHWAYGSVNEVFRYIKPEYGNELFSGSYNLDELISRGEVVGVISLALVEHNNTILGGAGGTEIVPLDSHDSRFAYGIEYGYYNGIISGYSDGTFRPENKITRAEISAVITNVIKFLGMPDRWGTGQTEVSPPQVLNM